MKDRYSKQLKKKKGLPLSLYYLEKDQMYENKDIVKLVGIPKLNSEGSRMVNFYKPISKI